MKKAKDLPENQNLNSIEEKNYYLVLSYCSDIKLFESENLMLAERAMLAERNSYVSRTKG